MKLLKTSLLGLSLVLAFSCKKAETTENTIAVPETNGFTAGISKATTVTSLTTSENFETGTKTA